jgi:hypothetical protein
MLTKVQLSRGQDCSINTGCRITLEPKNNSQGVSQKFKPEHKYYLLDGEVFVSYEGGSSGIINTPYTSTWTPYVDSWDYTNPVSLSCLPSTLFAKLEFATSNNDNTVINVTTSVIRIQIDEFEFVSSGYWFRLHHRRSQCYSERQHNICKYE